jgi:hypothetical protein
MQQFRRVILWHLASRDNSRARLLVSTNAGHAKQLKLDVRFTDSFAPMRAAAMDY